jgi:hypothetical protein
MAESKCPSCGCKSFYVKDPEDQYETYSFECREGEICFDADVNDEECPEINDVTEIFCNGCAWHDKFNKIK